jgi:hypothetical protein
MFWGACICWVIYLGWKALDGIVMFDNCSFPSFSTSGWSTCRLFSCQHIHLLFFMRLPKGISSNCPLYKYNLLPWTNKQNNIICLPRLIQHLHCRSSFFMIRSFISFIKRFDSFLIVHFFSCLSSSLGFSSLFSISCDLVPLFRYKVFWLLRKLSFSIIWRSIWWVKK